MIYFLYGTDTHKSREKLHTMLSVLTKKRPNSEVFKLNAENWDTAQYEELLGSQGLFDEKYIVVLDGLCEKKDTRESIITSLAVMQTSPHPFLIIEGKCDASSVKEISKHAEKVQESQATEKGRESYSIFTITDSLLLRDRRRMWADYVGFMLQDIPAEEVHGIVFWQVKNMLLASRAKDARDTGLTPFQYKKALAGTRYYSDDELMKMSQDLVDMTHMVRTGKGTMEILFEKWVLGV
jgi:DNA polymerase III delta subunit